jgi:hypothetical protein
MTKNEKIARALRRRALAMTNLVECYGFPKGSLAMTGSWAPYEEEGKITFQSAIISQVANL